MSTKLMMFNLGFLLYGGRSPDADAIAAPQVSLFRHKATLVVPFASIEHVPDTLKAELEGGLLHIDLSGRSLQGSGALAPAALKDFGHVPDFADFVSGVRLKADWRHSPSLQFRMDLTGGTLTSVYLDGGRLRGWQWQTPSGTSKTACFTETTLYETELDGDVPRLHFRAVTDRGEGAAETLTLKPGSPIVAALVNEPLSRSQPDGEEEGEDVDFAHIRAMFTLCDVKNPHIAFGADHECGTKPRTTPLPGGPIRRIFEEQTIRLFGRPHCGGRVMFE
jgi:hypothetical protein